MDLSLWDAHVHLGWFADPTTVARDAAGQGLGMLAVTVTPEEYLRLVEALAGEKNVDLAAGLHPWWVRDARDVDALCELLPDVRLVGEIGLDAAPRRAGTWDAQLAAFEHICRTCAEASDPARPKVLSIHAVRAATAVLDVLEQTGASERCRCVLHWFSGSSEELWRAVRLGCWFSLGERSLATRRGREYARVLPMARLLSETDLPEEKESALGAELLTASLGHTVEEMARVRDVGRGEIVTQLRENAEALLA